MIDTIKTVTIIGLGVCGGILLSDYIKKNLKVEFEKEDSNSDVMKTSVPVEEEEKIKGWKLQEEDDDDNEEEVVKEDAPVASNI